MVAARLLPKQTVSKKLKAEGCEKVSDSVIPDHSYWKTQTGLYFYVPEIGPDKMTPELVFHEIIADILKANGKN